MQGKCSQDDGPRRQVVVSAVTDPEQGERGRSLTEASERLSEGVRIKLGLKRKVGFRK